MWLEELPCVLSKTLNTYCLDLDLLIKFVSTLKRKSSAVH